jgi:hypothetical protein
LNVELTGGEAGLVAYYRFNDGSGQTAADSSGNGQDAVLGSNSTVESIDPAWAGDSGGQNLELPVVDILSPSIGSWLSRTIAVTGDVSDDTGIAEITIDIDGAIVDSPTTNSFRYDWDTSLYGNGPHVISVTARDLDDNERTVSRQITVDNFAGTTSVPYPYSTDVVGIEIASQSTMVSKGFENDNWPITWADDGDLYTAYGDGWGFRSEVETKLSLGYAKIVGDPPSFDGINIRSPTGERIAGNGDAGKKGSGMLMVDGVMYMWVRNANQNGQQCELAWSNDYAVTWNWNTWRFEEFGYCSFLNFGQNYAGSRDDFVYMYSPNSPTGTIETDEIILTRVPRAEILNEAAYEFFVGLDINGDPIWSSNIADRGPVYEFPGGSSRLDVVYNPGLGRYLMTMRGRDRALAGNPNHFSIYEAPEPWGPWTTVYYSETYYGEPLPSGGDWHGGWDESQRFPSKWIDPDGTGLELLCSCFDAFSVVHIELTTLP